MENITEGVIGPLVNATEIGKPKILNITSFEQMANLTLGLMFLAISFVAFQRILAGRQTQSAEQRGGAETTVVTAFYYLILLTSFLRTIWFLIPRRFWVPSYIPRAYLAFDPDHPAWVGSMLSEAVVTAGSLSLFAIFILILVYWADILKKYFYPGARRTRPMMTFFVLVGILVGLELLNGLLFLLRVYSSEAVILINSILLALVSLICVLQISMFSHRFRTVLKTLGAINQVSTEAQVQRIVWITITGNLFFWGRALLEIIFASLLFGYWTSKGSVDRIFSHRFYDSYILLKHFSEVAILCLMVYILQSRFAARAQEGYQAVPEAAGVKTPQTAVIV